MTAGHVLDSATKAIADLSWDCMAGPLEIRLGQGTFSRSSKADLATIRLTKQDIETLKADGRLIVQPATWPPTTPDLDDLATFAGFPARLREIKSWYDGQLNVISEQALVVAVRDDGFSYAAELADVRQFDVESGREEPVLEDMGGVSGGPVFRISLEPIVSYDLCGVVTEAGVVFNSRRSLVFTTLDYVRADGTVA